MKKYYTGNNKIYGVYHKIINNIPVHNLYFELFCGSAAIYKELSSIVPKGKAIYHINDIDLSVMDQLKLPANVCGMNSNAFDIIKKLINEGHGTQTFIYMDPPFLHSTRHSPKYYNYELTDTDHLQLLELSKQLKCNVMILHPKCDLYDNALKDWRKVEIKVRYRSKTSIQNLYMNYPAGTLQTNKYLGTD